MSYDLHPLCTLFPRLAPAEFAAMVEDVKVNGLREPITLHDGMILDGGNRYRACVEAGIEPTFKQFDGSSIVAYVLSANLHRRHLSPGQQAAIVASAQDWAKAQPRGGDRKSSDQSATLHFDSAEKRAAESGASLRTQKMADKVAKADPALAKKVAHGEVSLPKAVEQVSVKKPAATPAPVAGPEDDLGSEGGDTDIGDSPEDLLEDMQRDLREAQAQVKALSDGDSAAQLLKALQRAEHAERRQAELMQEAARSQQRAAFYERQLARIGRAVGQKDLDQVAPAVEALVRATRKAAA